MGNQMVYCMMLCILLPCKTLPIPHSIPDDRVSPGSSRFVLPYDVLWKQKNVYNLNIFVKRGLGICAFLEYKVIPKSCGSFWKLHVLVFFPPMQFWIHLAIWVLHMVYNLVKLVFRNYFSCKYLLTCKLTWIFRHMCLVGIYRLPWSHVTVQFNWNNLSIKCL